MDEELQLKLLPPLKALRLYHRHEVHGISLVPQKGSVIIACTHSLATYDILLLMTAIFQRYGRFPRSLIDRAFYKLPGLGELMEKMGSIVGTHENAVTLLENGEVLYLAPGGMRESLRPSDSRYQIIWGKRRGFAKLAIETGSPVVLAACPRADDIFKVYRSPLTAWIYQNFKLPFAVARGVGPTLIPRPVKLDHYLSEPIIPPPMNDDPAAFKRQIYHFHKKLVQTMNEMIKTGVVPS